jgi:predicted flap endonuclease-1-like 5' DNA nuclease
VTVTKLLEIEGVGPKYASKLQKAGVRSTGRLLERGATPTGRKELAAASGISDDLILEWVNHVDLFRVKGVGSEYADLLEEAGVDTVVELAQRNAESLYEKMLATNTQKKLVRRPPGLSQVRGWIQQAKKMKRVVSY